MNQLKKKQNLPTVITIMDRSLEYFIKDDREKDSLFL